MAAAADPVGNAGAMNNPAAQGEFTQAELDWAAQALANPKKSPFTSQHETALSEAAADETLPAPGYIRYMAKLFWMKLNRLQRQPITPVDFCIVMREALANLPAVPKHLGGGEPQSDEEARDVILVRLEQLKDRWMCVIAQCDNVNRIFNPEELDGIIESAEEKQSSIRSILNSATTQRLLPSDFIATMRNTLCQDANTVFERLATL